MVLGGLEHVRIDEHGQHAQGFILFDESHAAHVRGKVIDFVHALGRQIAIFLEIEIKLQIFDVIESLIPFIERFHVHGADVLIALLTKFGDKVAANKAACAGY
jgi:predicted HTH transcriptional regulator